MRLHSTLCIVMIANKGLWVNLYQVLWYDRSYCCSTIYTIYQTAMTQLYVSFGFVSSRLICIIDLIIFLWYVYCTSWNCLQQNPLVNDAFLVSFQQQIERSTLQSLFNVTGSLFFFHLTQYHNNNYTTTNAQLLFVLIDYMTVVRGSCFSGFSCKKYFQLLTSVILQ